jgi:predicted nucleic acid-binding protein
LIYWDTSYIVRLYVQDRGWQTVRQLAETDRIACSLHGQIEAIAAFHRKLRDGLLSPAEFGSVMKTFQDECRAGAFSWLPITSAIMERAHKMFLTLPVTTTLRGADALHLGCAAENGFKEIFSNDKHLLNAGSHFGLAGKNVI